MKTTKKIIPAILFLLFCINLFAQQDSMNVLIQKGITQLKEAYFKYDADEMIEVRSVLEKAFDADKSNLVPLYFITLADYKLIEMSLRSGGPEQFNKYYENGLANADSLSADKSFAADGKVLEAAIYMMKIAANPMSGATLSFEIHSLLDQAQDIDPENPYSYVIRGMMNFNTPQMFGGSYKEALRNFSKAAKFFENKGNEERINPGWGYAETYAWIGRTQEMLNNNEAALFAYKKALSIAPEFVWVKNSLLPELEKKLNSNK